MKCITLGEGGFLCGGFYKAGDPKPAGYGARQEWAEIQVKGGLKQTQCGHGKWLFPQELPCNHE